MPGHEIKATELTALLNAWRDGDSQALEELFRLVYPELRARAHAVMRSESPGHTLPPTALVHEAFLRLFDGRPACWDNGPAFLRAAAGEMRRVVVDHARRKKAAKRQSHLAIALPEEAVPGDSPWERIDHLLDLDQALASLAREDSEAAALVELRYFAGLENQEAAAILGLGERTAERRWAWARAWLQLRLRGGTPSG